MKFNIEKIKPTNKEELKDLIRETIIMYGYGCDLNFIDTSLITDMSWIFSIWPEFSGDISEWNVSNVIDMAHMFYDSEFNGDISKWDTSNVIDMQYMFRDSKFTGNIDDWIIGPNCDITKIFSKSELEFRDRLPKWYKV